jgi:hypothetical protein
MLKTVIIALIPLPLFYLIYFRHLLNRNSEDRGNLSFLVPLEFFFFGMSLAFGIVLISPVIGMIPSTHLAVVDNMIKGGIIEKTGSFLIIVIILTHY